MRMRACVLPMSEMVRTHIWQMAKSDKKRCPKGGWADYRNGPWYKLLAGLEQGAFMKVKHEKAYGHGAHADEPFRCSGGVYIGCVVRGVNEPELCWIPYRECVC